MPHTLVSWDTWTLKNGKEITSTSAAGFLGNLFVRDGILWLSPLIEMGSTGLQLCANQHSSTLRMHKSLHMYGIILQIILTKPKRRCHLECSINRCTYVNLVSVKIAPLTQLESESSVCTENIRHKGSGRANFPQPLPMCLKWMDHLSGESSFSMPMKSLPLCQPGYSTHGSFVKWTSVL